MLTGRSYENTVQLTTPTFTPHLQTNGCYHNNQLCFEPVFPFASCRVHDNATSAAEREGQLGGAEQAAVIGEGTLFGIVSFWVCKWQ